MYFRSLPDAKAIAVSFVLSLTLVACAPRVIVKKEEPFNRPRITRLEGDTLSFLIQFEDTLDRARFLSTFDEFLRNYPFATASSDLQNKSIIVKIQPLHGNESDGAGLTEERSKFVESAIEQTVQKVDSTGREPPKDTVEVTRGGIVKLLLQRGFLDMPFLSLAAAPPFAADKVTFWDKAGKGIFTIADSAQRDVTLKLDVKTTDGRGEAVSALQVIDLWTGFVKNHPAEGLALFRRVQGIDDFIKGQEAIIRGFGATDDKTIRLRLSAPDADVLQRLRTPRLLGENMRLGPYFVGERTGKDINLVANKFDPEMHSYLDNCSVRLNGESNPILSFSLNRYDAIVISSTSDLSYARMQLASNSKLIPLFPDRYFIACALEDPSARAYIKSILDPANLLRNFVKAEGQTIQSVTINQESVAAGFPQAASQPAQRLQPPVTAQVWKIICKGDDPPSRVVAEKLLADLSHAGLKCELKAYDERSYESALVMRDYACAIGYVPSTVTTDRSEQLRMATMWFGDNGDENQRIQDNREFPLFTVNTYILARPKVFLHNGEITGIFLKKE